MTEDLQRLVERIEAASGPDREIDAEIAKTIGWDVRYDRSDPNDREPYYQPVAERSWKAVPSYTASLDAAMTLVPAKCRFNLNKRPNAEGRQDGYHAQVWFSRYYETSDDMPNAWAAAPALALAGAALRSRITERQNDG